ncbi:Plasmodium exported protein (PHIST), unknown, putative [Plasmodium gaboni]|uniref:Plasmodium RESA N-terminal domain-containing protein n=1 Tax=Plasmodium gaboni TaxID=647221 RepID=A0ABY0KW53_9APIC|nr:Plasmodium exported protein (PHIST), unknown, putative [Plasmodium gaboni]
MARKKGFSVFPFYLFDDNRKRKFHYISFKLLCLSLYIIGFYYVFLNTSLQNKCIENVKNGNIYERNLGEAQTKNKGPKWKRYLKYKKEDVSKTKSNENIKSNEEKVEENKHSTNNDMKNSNVENKSNISISNINYNDISKSLTEKELFEVLNSFEECPAKEDLRNIWNHTMGVAKEDLDNIYQQLKASIQKYLDDDFLVTLDHSSRDVFAYNHRLKEHISRIIQAVGNEEVEYTKDFYKLINNKHTLDDILKFIYSYLERLKTLKKELHQKHQKGLLADVEQEHYTRKQCKIRR